MNLVPIAPVHDSSTTIEGTTALASPAARYHSLDALRATALLLGVFLHAALAYLPGPGIGWATHDRSTNVLFGAAILVVHSFRLELFFLMAGFFARLLYERRGLAGFTRNRLLRVLVPFAAGWFLVFPWLAFAWIWGGAHGEPNAALTALKQGFGAMLFSLFSVANFKFLRTGFPLTHLWFLYYLLLIYALFFAVRAAGIQLLKRNSGWAERSKRWPRALIESRWGVLVLAAATWALLGLMKGWDVDTPDKTLIPHLPALLLFGLFFSVGWVLHAQTDLLDVFHQRQWFHLAFAALLSLPVLLLSSYQSHAAEPRLGLIRAAYLLMYGLMMWCWVLGLLGLFLRFREQPSRFWRYLSDSSYWIYIIHLPVVVILQVALARQPLSCWSKFGITCAGTMLFALLTYQYLVRPTFIGLVLNGRRHPFRLWPAAES